jgi:hypothetical protein
MEIQVVVFWIVTLCIGDVGYQLLVGPCSSKALDLAKYFEGFPFIITK